jgi:dTDP-4-amino-4,6-dideoxygalactose transaminase
MFIINPDTYSMPSYRIGPFTTRDLGINAALPVNNEIDDYFISRFGHDQFIYTENGRQAIHLALQHYNLQPDDVVTILTTTGNFYISGCVTKEIERYCKWSRTVEENTKLFFVNHEFGYPFRELEALKNYNLPIIEDCANSFFSNDEQNNTGNVGDFVIYSFPKMFPVQVGGLLKKNIKVDTLVAGINADLIQYIRNVLSEYIKDEVEIISKRNENYQYLEQRFTEIGYSARFEQEQNSVPGVFMFRVPGEETDLAALKQHFYANGIQCSVFYGERTFFIPCHQNLATADLDYFTEVMKAFPVPFKNELKND